MVDFHKTKTLQIEDNLMFFREWSFIMISAPWGKIGEGHTVIILVQGRVISIYFSDNIRFSDLVCRIDRAMIYRQKNKCFWCFYYLFLPGAAWRLVSIETIES